MNWGCVLLCKVSHIIEGKIRSMPKAKFDPKKHHRPFDYAQGRKSIRLQGYDYSQAGAYYVTIVTYHRDCLFGEIVNEEMHI